MNLNGEFQPIIIADSLGSYLSTLVEDIPKPLLTICNRPLLFYQLDLFEKAGFDNVIILSQELTKQSLQQYVAEQYSGKLSIQLYLLEAQLGIAQTLLKLRDTSKKQFIVTSGDLIIEPKFIHTMLDYHLEKEATVTIALKENAPESSDHTSKALRYGDIIGIEAETGSNKLLMIVSSDEYADTPLRVAHHLIDCFPSIKLRRNIIDTQFYIFSRFALDILEKYKMIKNLKHEFIPLLLHCQYRPQLTKGIQNENMLSSALKMSSAKLSDTGVYCLAHILDRKIYCIRVDTVSNFLEANRDLAAGNKYFVPLEPAHYKSFVAKSASISKKTRIGDQCVVGDASKLGDFCTLKSSVVGKHCTICNNVKIINCVIMDHVTIKENCKLVNTVVCSNAYINEKSILKDSVVGYRCTVEGSVEHDHATLSVHSEL
ncbi:translation initiation factor eIF-2B subunit gamma-like [Schistocerca gregaria]|uniref:translation initiation factor eIF-2B subunit gamma-like n=1 Tax=Schistocerca gregaria TaxID=7010 RepID=UPI00211E0001|nr:translation initiation factor eIF-2B subunit gamma-like [Schistocerca gregaria]